MNIFFIELKSSNTRHCDPKIRKKKKKISYDVPTIDRLYMPVERHYAWNVTFVRHVQEHYVSEISKRKASQAIEITPEYQLQQYS